MASRIQVVGDLTWIVLVPDGRRSQVRPVLVAVRGVGRGARDRFTSMSIIAVHQFRIHAAEGSREVSVVVCASANCFGDFQATAPAQLPRLLAFLRLSRACRGLGTQSSLLARACRIVPRHLRALRYVAVFSIAVLPLLRPLADIQLPSILNELLDEDVVTAVDGSDIIERSALHLGMPRVFFFLERKRRLFLLGVAGWRGHGLLSRIVFGLSAGVPSQGAQVRCSQLLA